MDELEKTYKMISVSKMRELDLFKEVSLFEDVINHDDVPTRINNNEARDRDEKEEVEDEDEVVIGEKTKTKDEIETSKQEPNGKIEREKSQLTRDDELRSPTPPPAPLKLGRNQRAQPLHPSQRRKEKTETKIA